jgi:hypothetical protein
MSGCQPVEEVEGDALGVDESRSKIRMSRMKRYVLSHFERQKAYRNSQNRLWFLHVGIRSKVATCFSTRRVCTAITVLEARRSGQGSTYFTLR